MFGKQKKKSAEAAMTDLESLNFLRRLEYESYRPAEYRLYPKLEESALRPIVDKHLEALFAGEVDDANGDMLDSIIFGPAREAVPDLNRQHYDHGDVLRRLIARRAADRADFERLLQQRKQELQALEAEHEQTRRAAARWAGREERE